MILALKRMHSGLVAGAESSMAMKRRKNGAIEVSDPATQAASHKNPSP